MAGNITYSGAVYNHYLKSQMDLPGETLEVNAEAWDKRTLWGKVLATFNPIGPDMPTRARAAKDLIAARDNQYGESANRINWKLEAYRKEESMGWIERLFGE
tara:strand:+ start:349 stop:654 length:306 start_codon:yes stop_codon:yes gene_type:complete